MFLERNLEFVDCENKSLGIIAACGVEREEKVRLELRSGVASVRSSLFLERNWKFISCERKFLRITVAFGEE